jgi:hypothetical protein
MGAQPRMSDLINEMNGALQLEEGPNAEEGAMNIEIPQYVSQSKTCASLETTLEEIKLQTIFDEKSTSDCDPKGKRRQQPQTSTTQSHGSRSVFQIVPIYHLMQEMTRGLIVNNLCCGTV